MLVQFSVRVLTDPCLGKSCSFPLLFVPFVNVYQFFMYVLLSLLVLRVACGM